MGIFLVTKFGGHRIVNAYLVMSAFVLSLWGPAEPKTQVNSKGKFGIQNVTLGGLFSLHRSGKNGLCSTSFNLDGVKEYQAMLFAIDRINTDDMILPNISLSAHLFDTCEKATFALDYALKQFVFGTNKNSHGCNFEESVIGVIGPGSSYEAMYIARTLGVFRIPVISYSATSFQLSDKTKYKYFSRTVPSDASQTSAIVELLLYFNWTYVSIVYSDEPYGRMGFQLLKKKAKSHGICLAVEGKLPTHYEHREYQAVIDKLAEKDSAKIIVLFSAQRALVPFLKDMQKRISRFTEVQLVGSESVKQATYLQELAHITEGLIYTSIISIANSEFEEYFSQLNAVQMSGNAWFEKFYEQVMNCSLDEITNQSMSQRDACNASLPLGSKHQKDSYLYLETSKAVIDAVYIFAYALNSIFKNNSSYNSLRKQNSGELLLQKIRNVTFTGSSGRQVRMDTNGDVPGEYAIYYVERGRKKFFDEHDRIGEWEKNLKMNDSLSWPRKFLSVRSRCSDPCAVHQIQRAIPGKASCCWKCEDCPAEALVFNKTTCLLCARGYFPNNELGLCTKIQPIYYGIDGDVPLSLVLPPLLVSGIGIFAVAFTMGTLVRLQNTPLVKASSRELCYFLLFGIFLSYLFPFICVFKPSLFTCLLQFLLDSFPTNISYAAIAVKTNRIFRIFNEKHILTKRPSLARTRSQILLSIALISFQLLLLSVLVVQHTPNKKLIYFSSAEVHLVCSTSVTEYVLSYLYNILLIVVCTYYAYKTRHIPRNFNEAKFIAYAMYCSCVIIVTFLVVSVIISETSNTIHLLAVSVYRVVLMSTAIFSCFFAPKLYIILLRPEENINRPTFDGTTIPTGIASEMYNEHTECRYCRRRRNRSESAGSVEHENRQ